MDFPKSIVGDEPEVIKPLVVAFFKALDDDSIPWAIQHGWYGLPAYARHDIDVLLNACDVKRAIRILRKVSAENGWKIYASFHSSILRSFWLVLGDKDQSYFQVDLLVESGLRGVSFFRTRSSDALKRRWRNENGIWCVEHSYAAASVLLKEVLANGKLEGELRKQHIADALVHDAERFHDLLLETFKDERLVSRLIDVCKASDWDAFPELAPEMRRKYVKFRVRNTAMMVRYVYDYFRLRFFPFFRLFVIVVGPDGCGKTSVAEGIVRRFHHRPFFNYRLMHANFWGVVRLREVKRSIFSFFGRKIVFAPDPKPGEALVGMTPALGRARSMFYILYYGLWMCLGHVKLWAWRSFSSILVADRYYHDYYYSRGHVKSPVWYKHLIELIVPRPKLIFYLHRPAEEIFAQKPELTVEEIKRQQQTIRELLGRDIRFREIDAGHGLDETITRVNAEIEKWIFNQRG